MPQKVKYTLRLSPALMARVENEARRQGFSVNAWICKRLDQAAPTPARAPRPPTLTILREPLRGRISGHYDVKLNREVLIFGEDCGTLLVALRKKPRKRFWVSRRAVQVYPDASVNHLIKTNTIPDEVRLKRRAIRNLQAKGEPGYVNLGDPSTRATAFGEVPFPHPTYRASLRTALRKASFYPDGLDGSAYAGSMPKLEAFGYVLKDGGLWHITNLGWSALKFSHPEAVRP